MEPFQLFRPVEFQLSFVACFSQLGQATGTIYSLNEFFTPRPWGCRHVRPVRQLGVNLPKTAVQKHKQYPRFQVEIRGISFHLFPQVAGGFAFLPYAATLCGTQRMEIRRFKITFRLLPLGGSVSAVSSFQLRPVFSAVSSRVPLGNAMSRFVGFRDKIWDNFKNLGVRTIPWTSLSDQSLA